MDFISAFFFATMFLLVVTNTILTLAIMMLWNVMVCKSASPSVSQLKRWKLLVKNAFLDGSLKLQTPRPPPQTAPGDSTTSLLLGNGQRSFDSAETRLGNDGHHTPPLGIECHPRIADHAAAATATASPNATATATATAAAPASEKERGIEEE